jgi:hypothetical protein
MSMPEAAVDEDHGLLVAPCIEMGRIRLRLAFGVVDGSARSLPDQQARLQQTGKRGLDRVATGSSGGDDGRHRHAGLAREKFADRPRKRGKRGKGLFFCIQAAEQAVFLRFEGFEQKQKPGVPCRLRLLERGLGLAEGQIVSLLVGLNDAFQAGIGDVGVAGLQQQERGQDPG